MSGCASTTQNVCNTLGGFFLATTPCNPNPVCNPATDVCCCCGRCLILEPSFCVLNGGTVLPAGTTCSPLNPCPTPGVCCDPATGNCQPVTNIGTCPTGWTQVASGTCNPNPCPQNPPPNTPCGYGACCFGTTCITTYACECLPKGGGFFGVGTTCANINCANEVFGACCVTGSGSCVQTTLTLCNTLVGNFFPGQPCGAIPCQAPTRACCCCDKCVFLEPAMCQLAGGTVLPVGTPCSPYPCPPVPVGACCNPATGLCQTGILAIACQPPNIWFASNVCNPNPCLPPPQPCSSGACCDPNGTCYQADPCHCQMTGGHFAGVGTVCNATSCPSSIVFGACCLGNFSSCINTTQNLCNQLGGFFYGNQPCGVPGTCPPASKGCCCCNVCYVTDPAMCGFLGGTLNSACMPGTPCPGALGACCDSQGNCTPSTQAACPTPPNFAYYPNGVCAPNPCPLPCSPTAVGACCAPSGVCRTTTQCDCILNGEDWVGVGTVCGQVPCPATTPGACCLSGNSTCVQTSNVVCAALGGNFLPFTPCSNAPCGPPTQACCCCGICVMTDPAFCTYAGGTVVAIGVTCAAGVCTPQAGACCDASGNCTPSTAAQCPVPPNQAFFANGVCTPNPCPPPNSCTPGACCDQNGTCFTIDSCNCILSGYQWLGTSVTCTPTTCPSNPTLFGSCCLNNMTACTYTTQTVCAVLGGQFFPNVPCSLPGHCVQQTGACCCCNHCYPTDPDLCAYAGGVFNPFIVCAPQTPCGPPVNGACCDANGNCTQTTQAACPIPPNVSWTAGTACNPNPCCPSGACCINNNQCVILTRCECKLTGGFFLGVATTCANVNCGPVQFGSCCVNSTGNCVNTDAATCSVLVGLFTPNIPCTANPCTKASTACCCCNLCFPTDPTFCQLVGGTAYLGITCAPLSPCPAVQLGSCCDFNGNCTQTTFALCPVPPNLSWTPGGTCLPNNPCTPVMGACCDAFGFCTQTTQANCPVPPNASWNQGTACLPNPCVAVGACCDYVQQNCFVIPQSACPNVIGYLWLGAGTLCNPNPCPGACCDPNTGICTNVTAANCPAASVFTPWGNCNPNPCQPVGGCCLSTGCVVITQSACQTQGGTYLGNGSNCNGAPLQCPGACCLNSGPCIVTTFPACFGNQWLGIGTVCSVASCPPGACCFPNGTCTPLTQAQCGAQGGTWQGAAVPCVPVTPCPGACCTFSGPCVIATNSSCNGTFQGPGTVCTPTLCPTGACCQPNGACFVTIPFGCLNIGGQTYMGNGTTCTPNPCLGSCCTGQVFGGMGHICNQVTFSQCQTLNGQWKGYGVPCQNPAGNYTACCYANFNGQNNISVQDIFDFLTAFFNQNLAADCDGNNVITPNDLFCFLAAYFTGCQ